MNRSESRRLQWAERRKAGLCIYCGQCTPEVGKSGCKSCLEKKVAVTKRFSKSNPDKMKQYRLLIKHQVIEKYGGCCACCGESEMCFLTIDHINNDGGDDRRRQFGTKTPASNSWYLKLRREAKREDLQVLCFNCNMGKNINGGVCPHKAVLVPLSEQYDSRHNPQFDTRLKIVWPTDDELIDMCNRTSTNQVAKELGVDFSAVSGRLKRRGKYHLVKKKHGGTKCGAENPSSVLAAEHVLAIKQELVDGYNRKDLAKKYNVSKSTIDKIATNKTWKDLDPPG